MSKTKKPEGAAFAKYENAVRFHHWLEETHGLYSRVIANADPKHDGYRVWIRDRSEGETFHLYSQFIEEKGLI